MVQYFSIRSTPLRWVNEHASRGFTGEPVWARRFPHRRRSSRTGSPSRRWTGPSLRWVVHRAQPRPGTQRRPRLPNWIQGPGAPRVGGGTSVYLGVFSRSAKAVGLAAGPDATLTSVESASPCPVESHDRGSLGRWEIPGSSGDLSLWRAEWPRVDLTVMDIVGSGLRNGAALGHVPPETVRGKTFGTGLTTDPSVRAALVVAAALGASALGVRRALRRITHGDSTNADLYNWRHASA